MDVVFVIDRSTSVQDDESGGVANGVALLAEFAACIVDELDSWDDNVGLDRIRVAAINFATKATVEFTFNSNLEANADTNASGIRHTRTADDIVAALSQIKYDETPDVLTETNLHLGLQTLTGLMNDAASGYRGETLHVIVLTDGNVRNEAGSATALLSAELAVQHQSAATTMWAYGIGSNVGNAVLKAVATGNQFGTLGSAEPTESTCKSVAQSIINNH